MNDAEDFHQALHTILIDAMKHVCLNGLNEKASLLIDFNHAKLVITVEHASPEIQKQINELIKGDPHAH